MLERATACVEPGFNYFCRQIERPTRTKRTLDPSFWRHGAENRPKSAWWPACLQVIRNKSLAKHQIRPTPAHALELGSDDTNMTVYLNRLGAENRKRWDDGLRYGPPPLQNSKRNYSITHGHQNATSSMLHVIEEPEEADSHSVTPNEHASTVVDSGNAGFDSTGNGSAYNEGPVKVPLHDQQLVPAETLRVLLDSDDKEAYGKLWQLFIRVGGQTGLAGDVLEYLSTSHQRVDLDHAIRAYKLIPVAERGLKNYQAAIKVACRRKQPKLAVEIHHEALEKGINAEATKILLTFLVFNGLWKTAARVWDQLPLSQKNAANPKNRDLWVDFDQYVSLPEKLLQLLSRLEQNAAIFAAEKNRLFGLAVQLLYRTFSSAKIMSSITASGALALLDRFFYLDLLKPHHYFSAIQTLNNMVDFRNRHQLATLLYRNLDTRFPKVRLPRSVLGSLIAILCEADGSHAASRVILRRFATDWGRPDPRAYQKVLSACAQNGDYVSVQEVFTELCNNHGKTVDIEFITPLLYVHARMGDVTETKKQFDRLHSEFAFEPNAYCWNILITAYARARDHDGAFQEFRNMKRAGIKPDLYTYGILMSICARSGDVEAVHQIVGAARKQQIIGTSAMIDSLVHAYCLNDQIEDAENLVEAATQMRLKGSPTRMWNTLLRHHAFRADTDAVLQTQERMKESSVAADGMTYAALMQTLVNIGKTKDAASILRSLHLSRAITATAFHYSIVLYGYALENNRDMVAVIYNEMLERFPQIGLSARLSRLRLYAHRDSTTVQLRLIQALQGKPMNQGLRLSNTLDFLAQTLLDVNRSDLATDYPQPGLGRRSPAEAFPSVYLEFVIMAFARAGALRKAENLLGRYQALMDMQHRHDTSNAPSMQILTAIMIILVQQKRFAAVDNYWNKALAMAINKGRQRTLDTFDLLSEVGPPRPLSARPDAGEIGFRISAEDLGHKPENPFLDRGNIKILAAHRYSLAGPLTQYMYSVSAQNLTVNLPPLVSRLENMGFSLSSKNWNHYLQILSYSNDANMHILAFRLFEEKLLPNMPPWHLMKRSKWTKRKLVDGSGELVIEEPVQRKFVEKFHPSTLVPTYWTMVYLGLALMKTQQRGQREEKSALSLLRSVAPGTVSAVTRMPYLREKAQGLLLRGRTLQGDLQKRPRRPAKADRAGLRGSRSPLDHFPSNFPRDTLGDSLKADGFLTSSQPDKQGRVPADSAHPADSILGEFQRSPLVLEAAWRYERETEYVRRLRINERDKARVMKEIRHDAAQPRLMADDKYGEPFFEANLRQPQTNIARHHDHSPPAKERYELLEAAVSHFVDTKKIYPRVYNPVDASDIRPAAVLSAARRPKAAERLHLIRRRRRRRPAIPMSMAAFRRGIRQKVTLALTANQPRRRTTKRLQKAFTRNKIARRLRSQSRSSRKSRP
jgi:pentatricopeptide repeat-containing protein PET309